MDALTLPLAIVGITEFVKRAAKELVIKWMHLHSHWQS